MRIWDRTAHAWAIAGAAGFAALGILGALVLKLPQTLPVFGLAVLWYILSMRKYRRRRELAARPFPEGWRAALESEVGYYRRLPEARKRDFERDVAVFVGENDFAGVDEVEVTDELKVLAAASAVMLLFNRPDLEYQRISEVLFYPRAFSEESFSTRGIGRETIGMNHEFGAVILSAPELRRNFEQQSGRHVGLHEFAHALDRSSAQTWDGIPPGMSSALVSRWTDAVHAEQEKLDRGYSVLDPYARTNLVEFFAVAVETYFGLPELFRRDSTELFDVLDEYFKADPVSEDELPPRNKRRPDGK